MTAVVIILVIAAVLLYGWTMMRKTGIGQPGGKPDCGCGSGAHCSTNQETNTP